MSPPRMPLFNVFGPSTIRPLEKHMVKTHACVHELFPFFEHVLKSDWKKAEELYQKIAELEHDADQIKKDLRMHMPKDLFLPVARADILMMLVLQDKIANKAKDIAGLVCGRKMKFPEVIAESFMMFLKRSLDAENQARKAIRELDDIFEAGFRGKEIKLVEEMITELDVIEHDTDTMQIELRRKLYDVEKEYSPIDIIFLYKIIEWTGDLADHAQAVGGQLELLLAS
ncbi:MAG: TIGR00153 family protein [Gammaproteobacteria bacterium]